ncbi:TIGR00282 family metallophosphoesterase [Ruminococcus sp. YE282]|uniref:TIGR00282 family metallophosphoesterase n=1 Tax=Ruminococcus sp. YE282 TaxID=3158780 RepID=UPI00296F6D6C
MFCLRILCIGDVVGSIGCDFLRSKLPALKQIKGIDFVICNGENSSDGNGITPSSAKFLFDSGVDVITLGNHTYRRKEAYDFIDENPFVVRPSNFPENLAPGVGIRNIDTGRRIISVINVMGNMCMDNNLDSAFDSIDKMLSKAESKIIIVDFHAETTSEKRAMGYYLDGKISAMFGTHTHVQTSDAQVLPNGSGYITDVGMTGTIHSVLGVKTDIIINKFKTRLPARFDLASGDCKMECAVFDIDDKTGKCISAESLRIE